jgi:hypothetical protein
MAVIMNDTTTDLVDVDANALGVNIEERPRGDVRGAYKCGGISGIIAAATASASALFALRNGPVQNRGNIIITSIHLTCQVVTAPTVASATVGYDLVKFSAVTALSGGTTLSARPFGKRPWGQYRISSAMPTAGFGGDIRIATTGALTLTGPVFGSAVVLMFTPTTTTTPAIGTFYETVLETHGDRDFPIMLAPGEGIAIRTTAATPTTFTHVIGVEVDWYESIAADD